MQVKLRNMCRRILRATILALLFIICQPNITARSDGNEYNIKAMFVLNFIKYIEWPIETQSNTFRIGVIGESEMYDALKSMTMNRKETKQIIIDVVKDISKEKYKILIISRSENSRMEELLKKYKSKGVLIVTDEYTGKCSAAINLVNINNKMRFAINTSVAQEDGIKISSKLTELALTIK